MLSAGFPVASIPTASDGDLAGLVKVDPQRISQAIRRVRVASTIRDRVVAASARIRTASIAMSQANALQPAIDPGEIETITFDFADALGDDEAIISVTEVSLRVVLGTPDADAADRKIGDPTIVNSPSGAIAAAVTQQFGNMVGGATYQLSCLVETDADQTLRLRVNLPCSIIPS